MAIVLVIGGFVWALFACWSRRRASAPISQWSSSRRPRSSHTHGLNRTGFYRHSGCERRSNLSLASLTFQRQASLEQANSYPRKSSFRASTFHPFLQSPPLPVEMDSQLLTLPSSHTSPTSSAAHSLSRPNFHWSSNSLPAGFATPPPPAYESIIKAFPDSWAGYFRLPFVSSFLVFYWKKIINKLNRILRAWPQLMNFQAEVCSCQVDIAMENTFSLNRFFSCVSEKSSISTNIYLCILYSMWGLLKMGF